MAESKADYERQFFLKFFTEDIYKFNCNARQILPGLSLCKVRKIFIYQLQYNYILIIHELNNLEHVIGLVLQTRVSGENRIHDPLAHYSLDYQDTQP